MTGVREAFGSQAVWCDRLGSPFTAMLMRVLGEVLDDGSALGRAVLGWQGVPDAMGDSVPLRLAGGFHALVRRGRLERLARLYPPGELPAADVLTGAVRAAIAEADAELCGWLAHPPQTNEVGRSAVLFPGMMAVARETGLPLSIFEVGASGGLNLFGDRYCYRFGGAEIGEAGSPVVLAPRWDGDLPEGDAPEIVARRGCDRNPLLVAEAAHRERLVAYVWPDQPERLARVEAAVGLAVADPPVIDRADAADWVDTVLGSADGQGVARVLFHSIAYQYFPDAVKDRIAARMAALGRAATPDAPLAWLAFEQSGDDGPQLSLRLWPGGGERVLARADAHCRWVDWLG